MCDIWLLRKSYHDYKTAAIIFRGTEEDDEVTLTGAGYFLQQAVEKVLKGFLEIKGISVPKSHKITDLVKMTKDNGSACCVTDWIESNSYMLNEWEASTRYIVNYGIEHRRLQEAFSNVKDFMVLNGVCSQPLPDVTDEIKKLLLERIPLSDKPRDALEWNVLYRAFRFKCGIEQKSKPYVDFDMGAYFSMMGVTNPAAEIERLKKVYNTNDINEIKLKLKEIVSKLAST